MAKKRQEEPPKGSPAWMSTFSDLMNLLLCFFVLLFAMSNVDESKFNAISESMAISFSVFSKGSKAYGDGTLVSNGASQLNQLDEYYQSMGETNSSKEDEEIYEEGNQTGKDDKTGSEDRPNPSEGSTNNPVGDNNDEKGDDGDKTAPSDSQQTPGETEADKDKNNQGASDQNQENQGSSSSDKDENGDKTNEDATNKGEEDNTLINWQDQMYAANKEQTMNMYSEVSGLLDKFQLTDSISLSVDTSQYQYILLEVKGAVLFESGDDKIKKDAEGIIKKIGDILKIYGSYKVEVIGHTDSVPIKTTRFPNNNYLSTARAISVAQFLIDDCAISSDRITFSGRGEYEPIAPNNTKEGRERNRRVEFKLYNSLNSK